jgi:hypothetical protein
MRIGGIIMIITMVTVIKEIYVPGLMIMRSYDSLIRMKVPFTTRTRPIISMIRTRRQRFPRFSREFLFLPLWSLSS